uniref:DNA repair protein REV1 n=1 Tax=Pavo cristatus TaxID=9049 RepID=A0A8C9EIY4_PAVCR
TDRYNCANVFFSNSHRITNNFFLQSSFIKAGRLLSHIPYQLYTKQSSVQKGLNFNSVCKPEDAVPGPSNIAKDLNRVNHIKQCEMESEITPNGISSWNEEEEEDSDGLGFTELDQILPERKQNGIQSHKDSTVIFNGHTHNTCTSALKTQDCLVPSSNSVASRFSPGPVQEEGKPEKGIVDFRDCAMQQLQQSNKNTDFSWNPHRTMSNSSSSSSLHSNTKINGAHHSTVQGPSSTKSTSVPTPSKAASLSVSKPSDCSFISDFYSRSRLHHISTWKCELTEFVNSLQRKNSGVFPGREKLKKWKAGRSALKTDTGNVSVASSAKPQSCIMHVDMDCFFVSVSNEDRQDDSIISGQGTGRHGLKKLFLSSLPLVGLDSSVWEHSDSAHMNGVDCDLTVLSMAEIASCSSNILLARMATRKAKPDGQYHLKPEEVDDFIRGQLVTNLPGVGRSMESKLASLGIRTCGDLQCASMSKLQKEFGPKTGQMLYRFCRGLDDRPVRTEKERKSVSAEINYGIRFTQPKEAEAFLLSLSEEIQRRLEAAGMKGKRLTLKIMVRKAGAPVEPAKYGGHGICDNIARTVTLDHATDSAKVIGKETLNMFHTMKLNISDMRGVGIQVQQLVPIRKTTSAQSAVQSGRLPGGSHSVIDLLHVQKAKKCSEEEHKEVFVAAMDLEISSDSRTCTVLPSRGTHLTAGLNSNVSKTDSAVKLNGLHSPISVKSRLNLSIEVPSASQLDKSVLEALPPDLREQVEQIYTIQQGETYGDSKREPINGCNTALLSQPVGTVLLQVPELQEPNANMGINVIALPAFSQVDPEVFAALPAELQAELKDAYDQRQKQPEQQPANAFVSKNPCLQLKHATRKNKKKIRKKNPVSPVKKIQSPLKNRLLGSPAKNMPATSGSPQKLIDGFLKQEGAAAQLEAVPSTSDASDPSALQTEQCGSFRPQAPNLAGAVEFNDVKTLLKEWITTISGKGFHASDDVTCITGKTFYFF